jgi:cell division protein FtsN
MLPLVGVVAVGLLVVAGKLFFFSTSEELKASLPIMTPLTLQLDPVPQPQEKENETFIDEKSVIDEKFVDERLVEEPTVESPLIVTSVPALPSLDMQGRQTDPFGGVLSIMAVPSNNDAATPKSNVVVVIPPSPRPTPVVAPTLRPTPTPTPPKPKSANSTWMVQVGAFSTQAAADAFSRQVTKAGYKATVVSSKTLYRVLVQGENSRKETLALATQMSQNGFRGAFIVPPRQ